MAKGQAYKELNRFVRELLKMTVLTLYSSTAKSAKGANISHLFVTA